MAQSWGFGVRVGMTPKSSGPISLYFETLYGTLGEHCIHTVGVEKVF